MEVTLPGERLGMGDIAKVKIAGYRVGGRHQEKDETESAAAGQRYDEVSQNLHQGLESAMAPCMLL